MKEVDCVHCMGVSSQFKRIRLPANSEHTVLWRRRNVSVMLVIEEVGTANTHISAIFYRTAEAIFALSFVYSKLDFVTFIGTVCCRSGKHDATPIGH